MENISNKKQEDLIDSRLETVQVVMAESKPIINHLKDRFDKALANFEEKLKSPQYLSFANSAAENEQAQNEINQTRLLLKEFYFAIVVGAGRVGVETTTTYSQLEAIDLSIQRDITTWVKYGNELSQKRSLLESRKLTIEQELEEIGTDGVREGYRKMAEETSSYGQVSRQTIDFWQEKILKRLYAENRLEAIRREIEAISPLDRTAYWRYCLATEYKTVFNELLGIADQLLGEGRVDSSAAAN